MRIIFLSIFFIVILSANEYISSMKVLGDISNITPNSKAWLSASYKEVVLYPQTTLKDKNQEAKKIQVKSLYDNENISFLLKLKDVNSTIDKYSGFILQIPKDYKKINELPYIFLGNENREVIVHLKGINKDDENASTINQVDLNSTNSFNDENVTNQEKEIEFDYEKNFIAQGYKEIVDIEDFESKSDMKVKYKNGVWKVTFSKKLSSEIIDLNDGVFPISFAIWEANELSNNSLKFVSKWKLVKLIGKSSTEKLTKAFVSKPEGNIGNGKKLARENCAVCHRYENENSAAQFLAPNLSNIGGYATKEYIKESIENPSAVVVPGYEGEEYADFKWYSTDYMGKKVSTMPPYDWMDEKSKEDIITFFSTLKSEK